MLSRQMLMVADRCNLSCTYCYFETGEYEYRPVQAAVADYDRWLAGCAEVGPVEAVCFTGGEPLLRPDLLELVTVARRHADSVLLLTNAVRMTDDVAAALGRLGCAVDVSIDHVTADIADTVRGGTKASLAGVERLVAAGVGVQIVLVVTSVNWTDVEPVLAFAATRGCRAELILVSVPAQHPLSLMALPAAERQRLAGVLTRWRGLLGQRAYYDRLRHYLATGRLPPVRTCLTGQYGVFVNPDGDISVCGHRREPIGNIKRTPPRAVIEYKQQVLALRPAGPCASLGCLSITA